MGFEAYSPNEFLNFITYDTISTSPFSCHETATFRRNPPPNEPITSNSSLETAVQPHSSPENDQKIVVVGGGGGRKRRMRKPRGCKNKEEAETQRMTHIAVERNRRKQMNQHLAVLRSLMPESYLQKGDQASIVGGAIEFVKELEHLLQSLEAQNFHLTQQQQQQDTLLTTPKQNSNFNPTNESKIPQLPLHFQKYFSFPQYTWSQKSNTSNSKATMADIEVNLVQTHANLRILSQKPLNPLSKMVVFFQDFRLSLLHLNVSTLHPLVLYSISLKVEEGCWLKSADEIAGAVHQILRLIDEEETILCVDSKV